LLKVRDKFTKMGLGGFLGGGFEEGRKFRTIVDGIGKGEVKVRDLHAGLA